MTQTFVTRGRLPGDHPVDYFWTLIDQLGPEDYPPGVHRVPGRGSGTCFFSACAGLVRRRGEPLPPFPFGGVMFVGHNLNSVGAYQRMTRRGVRDAGDPDRPSMRTWQNAYALLRRAGVDPREVFFTNVYIGLKEGDDPRGPFPGRDDPSFCRWCAAFLDEQLRVMKPRVVVALGGWSQEVLGSPAGKAVRTDRAGVSYTMVGLTGVDPVSQTP